MRKVTLQTTTEWGKLHFKQRQNGESYTSNNDRMGKVTLETTTEWGKLHLKQRQNEQKLHLKQRQKNMQ